MQIVVWVLAGGALLVAAALIASVIDRRAGWNQIPLEAESSYELDERREIGANGTNFVDWEF